MDAFYHRRIALRRRLRHRDGRMMFQTMRLARTVHRKTRQWLARGYRLLQAITVTVTVTGEGRKRWLVVHATVTLMPGEGFSPLLMSNGRKKCKRL